MALVEAAIYFRNRNQTYGLLKEDPDTGIPIAVGILFDLLLTESHVRNAIVTDRPIEDGSIISDHIRNSVEQGSLTGMVTNFSIALPGLFSNRAQDAFDELEKLWQEKTLVTLVTVLKVYENVAITSFSVDRDADTGEETSATISFRKVNKVKLKTVEIGAVIEAGTLDNDNAKQAKSLANVGQQIGA